MTNAENKIGKRKKRQGSFNLSVVAGVLATVGWYLLLPYITFRQELLVRYSCGHPIAYAETAFFFIGAFILLFRAGALWRERRACNLAEQEIDSLVEKTTLNLNGIFNETLKQYDGTHIALRLSDLAEDDGESHQKQHIQETMKYLAEIAADRVHASFSFVRTIAWAIPILGFLGTVIGITLAIGNLNFQDYETSMKDVVGGLSIAFDTTALALTLSVVLVFGLFRVERSEQQILDHVEDFCRIRVLSIMATEQSQLSIMEEVPANLTQELFRQTENMVLRQSELWEESLDAMRGRWKETLQERETLFANGLEDGFSRTLSDHSSQLGELRNEMQQRLEQSQNVIAASQEDFTRSLSLVSEKVCESLAQLQDHEQHRQDRFLETFSQQMQQWNVSISNVSEGMVQQANELREVCEKFASLSDHGGQIVHLERQLHENLDTIRQSQTFEETLQTLSAAVNLLTTRTGRNAA